MCPIRLSRNTQNLQSDIPAAGEAAMPHPRGKTYQIGGSTAEQCRDVAAAMHHMQNEYYAFLFDAVDDDVVASRQTAQPTAQIIISPSTG